MKTCGVVTSAANRKKAALPFASRQPGYLTLGPGAFRRRLAAVLALPVESLPLGKLAQDSVWLIFTHGNNFSYRLFYLYVHR